jgi:HPt (histidine-containing phosphotransfer) domain-containing protein
VKTPGGYSSANLLLRGLPQESGGFPRSSWSTTFQDVRFGDVGVTPTGRDRRVAHQPPARFACSWRQNPSLTVIISCSTTSSDGPIYSSLASEFDLGPLVEMFVGEMRQRAADLQAACDSQNRGVLQRLAHQIKGAAGSYGFDPVTPVAEAVECAARDRVSPDTIALHLKKLLDTCRRLQASAPLPSLDG